MERLDHMGKELASGPPGAIPDSGKTTGPPGIGRKNQASPSSEDFSTVTTADLSNSIFVFSATLTVTVVSLTLVMRP